MLLSQGIWKVEMEHITRTLEWISAVGRELLINPNSHRSPALRRELRFVDDLVID